MPAPNELSLFDRQDLRANDLPPKWDGAPVVWEGWGPSIDNIFICPPPPKRSQQCSRCGSMAAPAVNRGTIRIAYSDTFRPVTRAATSSGGAWLRTLTAFRCEDCFLDTVVDGIGPGGQVWTLDESDYTDEGSWDDGLSE